MPSHDQLKHTKIDRGLFLIRYVEAEDEHDPPSIRVSIDPVQSRNVELIVHPDHGDGVLRRPGSCLVAKATAPAHILIEVSARPAHASSSATVKVEQLGADRATSVREARSSAPAITERMRVLGHVAGLGDLFAKAGEWLGGPTAPSRIEGIAVVWPDKPKGLDIRYSVKTAKPQPISDRVIETGSFAGTRGRALPIVGVLVEISGGDSALYQLIADALFVGSPCVRSKGRRVVLSGATGREPLVGLRLQLEEVEPAPETPAMTKQQTRRVTTGGSGSSAALTAARCPDDLNDILVPAPKGEARLSEIVRQCTVACRRQRRRAHPGTGHSGRRKGLASIEKGGAERSRRSPVRKRPRLCH